MIRTKSGSYLKYLVLALLIYMPVFGFLDRFPIRIWDESRLAVNAYEMFHNSDYIVTHFDGEPDLWNTKPPLMIWMQVGFMKLVGVNELAVRLPSAFAALFTFIVILLFANRYLKSGWFGFIAVMVLVTTHGYIDVHVTRTGDYDALLALFTTLSGLAFFMFCETKRNTYVYIFFMALALAVLTKSVNGLLFLPAFFIYLIIRKQLVLLLKNRHFYFALAGFLFLVAGYYLLREYHNPGFFAAVIENELGGRYLNTLDGHRHSFWYYYNNIVKFQFSSWYLLVPCGLALGLFSRNEQIKRLTIFSALMALTFFLVISSSNTKLQWYDVPLYPFLSMLVAVFIFYCFEFAGKIRIFEKTLSKNIVPFIFLFLIMVMPYKKIWDKTYLPKEYPWDVEFYEMGYYLKHAVKGKHDLNNQYLLYDGYNAHHKFYINLLNDKGVLTGFKDWNILTEGELVFTSQWHIKEYIENNYPNIITSQNGNITTYLITGEAPPSSESD